MLLALPFLITLGICLPVLGWLGLRHSRAEQNQRDVPGPGEVAVQIGIVQTVVAGLAVLAMYGLQIEPGWRSQLSLPTVLVALVVLGGVLLLSLLEARKPLGPNDHMRVELRKVTATNPAWIGVTIYAGFIEEFAYRGVLTLGLAGLVGYWPAATISAGLFGLAHLAGGWRAAAHGVIFGLAMQVIVFVSGGLLLAVLVHAVYDLVAAWLGRRIATRTSDAEIT